MVEWNGISMGTAHPTRRSRDVIDRIVRIKIKKMF